MKYKRFKLDNDMAEFEQRIDLRCFDVSYTNGQWYV